jgi:hypothetical protein
MSINFLHYSSCGMCAATEDGYLRSLDDGSGVTLWCVTHLIDELHRCRSCLKIIYVITQVSNAISYINAKKDILMIKTRRWLPGWYSWHALTTAKAPSSSGSLSSCFGPAADALLALSR